MKLAPQSRLIMAGDSITDAGRNREAWPSDRAGALGQGYVGLVAALLEAAYPGHRIVVHNRGVSGDTVRDLDRRFQRDVLDLKPDWLSIMIGTNDVWRQFDSPLTESAVPPGEFEDTLERLVHRALPSLKGLVLLTPFFLDRAPGDAMRQRMDEYGAIVRRIAERNGADFVDTQAAFDRHLEHQHAYRLSADRVHPNPTGHAILARAFLRAVGFEW